MSPFSTQTLDFTHLLPAKLLPDSLSATKCHRKGGRDSKVDRRCHRFLPSFCLKTAHQPATWNWNLQPAPAPGQSSVDKSLFLQDQEPSVRRSWKPPLWSWTLVTKLALALCTAMQERAISVHTQVHHSRNRQQHNAAESVQAQNHRQHVQSMQMKKVQHMQWGSSSVRAHGDDETL